MNHRGLVWTVSLVLFGCATSGNGGDVEGLSDDHGAPGNQSAPIKGPIGGGEGGGGAVSQGGTGNIGQGGTGNIGGSAGGAGGSGGGGQDCATVCAAKSEECTDSGLNCPAFCDGATSSEVMCLSGISCALISQCTGQPPGGGGAGGSGGSGGFGGSAGIGGSSGSCVYPTCQGCLDPCENCLCLTQNNTQACVSYCGS